MIVNKQKRQFWVILVIVFLGFLGISMPYLIFPALFLNPAYTILPPGFSDTSRALLLGITLAAYPLGQFFGSPILGSLSDDFGRKRLLSASLMLSSFCNLLTGVAIERHQLTLLILSRFAAGVMEGNIAIARAMAADLKTISKHETFGKINAAASIAYLIGPLIGGLLTDKSLYENFTTTTPFYLICVLFLGLAALSSYVIEQGEVASIKARSFWERINIIKRLSQLFTNQYLQFLMVTSTCFTLAVDMFYEFGPVYLTVNWGYGPPELVYFNGILCLTLAIGNGWLPAFFSSRFPSRLCVIYAIGALTLFLVAMAATNSSLLMLLLFGLSGLVIGLAVTLLTVKISNASSETIQGEVMGVQVSLRVLGDALICLFGGALLLISAKFILLLAAAISAGAMFYFAFKKLAVC